MDDESKTSVGHRKHIFWQTSVNNQNPKQRVCMNGIFIEGSLLDMGVDVSIITPESCLNKRGEMVGNLVSQLSLRGGS